MTTPTPTAAPKGLEATYTGAVPKAQWYVQTVGRHNVDPVGRFYTYDEAIGAARDAVEDGNGDAEVFNPEGVVCLVIDEFGAYDPNAPLADIR